MHIMARPGPARAYGNPLQILRRSEGWSGRRGGGGRIAARDVFILKAWEPARMFLPEDLISNIEDTCKENPQWMAKPVRWLKSLFDFAKWTDLMEPYPIKRLFDGEISDEQHTYQGMQDFQFLSAQDAS